MFLRIYYRCQRRFLNVIRNNFLSACMAMLFLVVTICQFRSCAELTLPQSSDLCWLIETGNWILNEQKLPPTDIFNWWHSDRSIVCYQWFFEISIAKVHSAVGLWGTGLLSNLIGGFLIFWFLPATWLRYGIPLWICLGFTALVPSRYWHFPRPQILASIYFAFLVTALEHIRLNPKSKCSWSIPIILLFWTNTHPTWVLALSFVFIYYSAVFLREGSLRREWRLVASLLLSLLSTLFNPYGAQLASNVVSFLNGSQYLKLYEVMPAYSSPDLIPFLFYCGVFLVVLIVNGRKHVAPETILVAIVSLILGLSTSRFEPFAVIGSWQCLGLMLASTIQKQEKLSNWVTKQSLNQWWKRPIVILLSLAIPYGCWLAVCSNQVAAFQQLIQCDPNLLMLPKERNQQRVFTDPITGNWMVYTKAGKPFITNQFDTYSKEEVQQVSDCLSGIEGWQRFLDENQVQSILIPKADPLFKALSSSRIWLCIADDKTTSYWERNQGLQK